jgi:hypothetical protein
MAEEAEADPPRTIIDDKDEFLDDVAKFHEERGYVTCHLKIDGTSSVFEI